MSVVTGVTTSEGFLNAINDKGASLTNNATPDSLRNAINSTGGNVSFLSPNETVVEAVNSSGGSPVEPPEKLTGLYNIYITNYPIKTNYIIGETFDPTGLVVMGQFNDGTSRELIPNKEYKLSIDHGNESTFYNVDKYKINYNSINLNAVALSEDDIELHSDILLNIRDENGELFVRAIYQALTPFKTQYVVGEYINLNGASINVAYSDNSSYTYESPDIPNYFVNTWSDELTTVGSINIPLITNDNINNPLNIQGSLSIVVTETQEEPTLNRYILGKEPYNKIFEPEGTFTLSTDMVGGQVIKVMTDGSNTTISLPDNQFDISVDDALVDGSITLPNSNQQSYVNITSKNNETVGGYFILISDNVTLTSVEADIDLSIFNKVAGDNLELSDLLVRAYFHVDDSSGNYDTSYNVNPLDCVLNFTNPLVEGYNKFSVDYEFRGVTVTSPDVGVSVGPAPEPSE